jgi:PPM family protein phosphatase
VEPSTPLALVRLSTGSLTLEATGATHVGLRRSRNEDTLGLVPEAYADRTPAQGYLFAVADGMGGAQKGDVASRLAVEELFRTYYDADADSIPHLPAKDALRASFSAANDAVYRRGLTLESGMMGTTLVACAVVEDTAIVANVGDSRAYLVRGGRLHQVSEDHSFVAEQVRAGVISAEEARHSPQRNIITRAIGHQPRVQTDEYAVAPLQPGDVLLLCSDGLHGLVEDADLLAIAQQPDLRRAAAEYVELANARGGVDNITCLLVRVLPPDASEAVEPSPPTAPDAQPAS